jgi:tetratricopeptide (TPR) repeat protein
MMKSLRPKVLSIITLSSLALGTFGCASRSHEVTRHLLEGNDAALRSDYTTAVNRYELALRTAPDSSPARRNLGIVLVKVGQYDRAKKNLLEVLPKYPDDVEVLYFLGECSRGLEDYNAASDYYQQAQRIDSSDLRITKALAWTWYKMRKYEKSLSTAEPLLKRYPGDLQVKLIAASTYNRLSIFQKTIDLLTPVEKVGFKVYSRDIVSAESERALLMTALADAYAGSRDCKRADALYSEVLRTRPFLASALIGSAKCDLSENQENKAISKLEKATRSNPDVAEPYYLLGRLYARTEANKSVFYYRRFLLLTKNNGEFTKEIQATRTALSKAERITNRATTVNGK